MVPGAQKAVVSMLDITDGKKTEETLRDLREKYQNLVENIHKAILVAEERLLKYGNARVERELRDSTEPLQGLLIALERIFVILNEK
jgi:PAS domain-containing protein